MSTPPDITTEIRHGTPDAAGRRSKHAFANSNHFLAVASIQQVAQNSDGTGVALHVRGLLFWQGSTGTQWKNVDRPLLTWESTDDELIAAAVKILKKAEGCE